MMKSLINQGVAMNNLLCGFPRWMRLITAWSALALGLTFTATGSAAAPRADLTQAEEAEVRAVVQAQLDAFAKDDADAAFSYAAPMIRQMMGTPQNFLAMVRSGYAVVHRPASVMFLKARWLEGDTGEVVQAVQMTDAKGAAWLAIYRMQRQDDKTWRIGGCVLLANEGKAT